MRDTTSLSLKARWHHGAGRPGVRYGPLGEGISTWRVEATAAPGFLPRAPVPRWNFYFPYFLSSFFLALHSPYFTFFIFQLCDFQRYKVDRIVWKLTCLSLSSQRIMAIWAHPHCRNPPSSPPGFLKQFLNFIVSFIFVTFYLNSS